MTIGNYQHPEWERTLSRHRDIGNVANCRPCQRNLLSVFGHVPLPHEIIETWRESQRDKEKQVTDTKTGPESKPWVVELAVDFCSEEGGDIDDMLEWSCLTSHAKAFCERTSLKSRGLSEDDGGGPLWPHVIEINAYELRGSGVSSEWSFVSGNYEVIQDAEKMIPDLAKTPATEKDEGAVARLTYPRALVVVRLGLDHYDRSLSWSHVRNAAEQFVVRNLSGAREVRSVLRAAQNPDGAPAGERRSTIRAREAVEG